MSITHSYQKSPQFLLEATLGLSFLKLSYISLVLKLNYLTFTTNRLIQLLLYYNVTNYELNSRLDNSNGIRLSLKAAIDGFFQQELGNLNGQNLTFMIQICGCNPCIFLLIILKLLRMMGRK